jgi:hypothetical protein
MGHAHETQADNANVDHGSFPFLSWLTWFVSQTSADGLHILLERGEILLPRGGTGDGLPK